LVSLITFLIFLADTLILTLLIPVLYIIPIQKKNKKYLYHYLIYLTSKIVVKINFTIKKTFLDTRKIDFSKPSVLVSNHQSHLDLVLILMQHPKIIVITNKWVWNNPFYGFVVRFADYYPIYKGIETGFDKIKQKVSEGYSILVFPEGSRTFDGNINRYHQGAFKLADDLNLKIQPIIIHGAYQCLPKTNFFLRSGAITLKFLDAIHVESVNIENNETYRVQAKQTTKLVREAYAKLQLEQETPKFYAQKVIHQYIYKGPVIEWYVRIKLKLENNYEFFNNVIPRKATIVDMGCGYGYFAYMLNCLSGERNIIGIDYDEEKTKVAQKIAEGNNNLSFKVQDIIEEEIPDADIYILNDVLHYMPENLQIKVLNKCLDKLTANGMLIVRDADAELVKRTKFTKYTEIQSTRIFKFNKTKYDLSFISGNKIVELAQSKGFVCERYDNSTHTSNITYIIKNAH
jgi:1-acyl-sn-glycerol-3-phosphate acyltransferase